MDSTKQTLGKEKNKQTMTAEMHRKRKRGYVDVPRVARSAVKRTFTSYVAVIIAHLFASQICFRV